MSSKIVSVALAAAVLQQAACNPVHSLFERQQCTGQSCQIASLSGSSGVPFTGNKIPDGSTYSGDCCVIHYNPAIMEVAYENVQGLQAYCSLFPYNDSNTKRDLYHARALEGIAKRQIGCSPKTLVYAKGTFEPGDLGVTVGPQLSSAVQSGAPGQWSVQGVDYDPSYDGDECLGLPGGIHATALIEKVASQCPSTKIFLSGYSQGAMVVRDGLANSTAGSMVKGLVTFGDPFNGAPVKGYNGPIRIYCDQGDGVCSGEFNITSAHLAYAGSSNITDAAAWLNSL